MRWRAAKAGADLEIDAQDPRFARFLERIALETYVAGLTGDEARLFGAITSLGAADWPADIVPAEAVAAAPDRALPPITKPAGAVPGFAEAAVPPLRRDAGAAEPGAGTGSGAEAGPAAEDCFALPREHAAAVAGLAFPAEALLALGRAEGLAAPERALAKLDRLGLVAAAGKDGWRLDPAARLAAPPRDLEDLIRHASAALPPLLAAWQDADGDPHHDARGLELHRLARLADQTPPEVLIATGKAAGSWLFGIQHDALAALALLVPLRAELTTRGHPADPELMLLTANAAERIGATALQQSCLRDGASSTAGTEVQRAILESNLAPAELHLVGPAEVLSRLRSAGESLAAAGEAHRRDWAINEGRIADILQAQGDLTEARRIREEEELPAYEALGDKRSIAITRGQIADILEAQGDLFEARRIREEEELPAYEALGDKRSIAVTRGQIADILQAQGDLFEARRIREAECLPAYEALGDKRSIAVTRGQIADILQAQGDPDGADRIRREEELPAYLALGAAREAAMVEVQLAQHALQSAGDALDLQQVYEDLAAAFQTFVSMKLSREIGHTGLLLAQVEAMVGHTDAALKTLDMAQAAFVHLQSAEGQAAVAQVRAAILGQAP